MLATAVMPDPHPHRRAGSATYVLSCAACRAAIAAWSRRHWATEPAPPRKEKEC